MRTDIVHIGAGELNYEIRQIATIAHRISKLSKKPIIWENIGDPVQKGEKIPKWIKEIVSQSVQEDISYAYSPTHGLLETKRFLANRSKERGGITLQEDDIIFFNGLGDAVNKVYYLLKREARIIGPSPAYPTHSSAEAGHAGYPPITYRLLPEKNWMPDLDELRNKVRYNESIAGILIINPDNPTGAVFPKEIVQEMIGIAKEYDLFIVADEIYTNMVFDRKKDYTPLSTIIGDVPAVSLKGISKEIPWPGARCGWMEVYNRKVDSNFNKYISSIMNAKMLEVCSTTLPQKVIPSILSHPEYSSWQARRNEFFQKRSSHAHEIFSQCDNVIVNRPDGAFYISVVFQENVSAGLRLNIHNDSVKEYVNGLLACEMKADFSFVYQLLGAKNICVVPLSSFVTNLTGFRSTLLEQDEEKFLLIYRSLAQSIQDFV